MFRVLGKIIYIALLIGLMIDAVVNIAMPYLFEPEPLTPALIVITTSVGFVLTYCLYAFKQSKSAIYVCGVCYLLYAGWQIGKSYFWPMWHQSEYLIIVVFLVIIGLPIFAGVYSQTKQHRALTNNV